MEVALLVIFLFIAMIIYTAGSKSGYDSGYKRGFDDAMNDYEQRITDIEKRFNEKYDYTYWQ